ncbi:hypothetical protein NDU88_006222 [Pleurodeles waltl]|uniref:Uncharacterized protein n=1 Tax=Pleurodeles waltl TaxID=8319 RepID=A0AAV7RR95_PLEWA|nr:hypothetical protein NDU88_006222 [Pleurodeles waltl]
MCGARGLTFAASVLGDAPFCSDDVGVHWDPECTGDVSSISQLEECRPPDEPRLQSAWCGSCHFDARSR